MDKAYILSHLKKIVYPKAAKDIVHLGWVKHLRYCDGIVSIDLEVPLESEEYRQQVKQQCLEVLRQIPEIREAHVHLLPHQPSSVKLKRQNLKGVKLSLAVASGKGGVGKSTIAVHLASYFAKEGWKTGLLDCDIYGPSIPKMLGLEGEEPKMTQEGKILPLSLQGLKVLSVGLLTGPDAPLIWRGPMVTQVIRKLLHQVEWGELDLLVLDLPPGTGDIQLTLCQSLPLSGAVIVSTPQDMSFAISRKALRMFERLDVPVLGILENMSHYPCSHCGYQAKVFGHASIEKVAQAMGIPYLGAIPLDKELARLGDQGKTLWEAKEEGEAKKALLQAASCLKEKLEEKQKREEEWKQSRNYVAQVRLPTPTEIEILWGNGESSRFSALDLRLACPCAHCVDEWTGEPYLSEKDVPLDIEVKEVHTLGNYALQFVWSDGHRTGIYTFDYLHKLEEQQNEAFEI